MASCLAGIVELKGREDSAGPCNYTGDEARIGSEMRGPREKQKERGAVRAHVE